MRLVTGGVDRIVRIWDTRTWHQVGQFETEHPEAIADLQVSADGRYVLTTGVDTASNLNPAHVVLWDAADGVEIFCIRLSHAPASGAVSLSPNGRMNGTNRTFGYGA